MSHTEKEDWKSRVNSFRAQRDLEKNQAISIIKSIAQGNSKISSEEEMELAFKNLRLIGYEPHYADVLIRYIPELAEWVTPTEDQYISVFLSLIKPQEEEARLKQELQAQKDAEQEKTSALIDFDKRLMKAVEKHQHTLLKKRRQLLWINDYGVIKGIEKWNRELINFIDDVVQPPHSYRLNYEIYIKKLDALLKEDSCTHQSSDVHKMSGEEFERYCTEILKSSGWKVIHKGKTGDQGVDIISEYNKSRVAIQCKRYASSIGNKAVQEVYSGKNYEECDIAVVVSNAKFTASAVQLAQSLGVFLIDISELPDLKKIIFKEDI
ncbi:restriction endonuclease [uncultured Comamonas sp.]|uniref:restriction endonuclease n=1 Tax=uncultured Comamonas sp. TaxID=114710 RepID=UPI0025FAC32F|nr:restriction endonuclease [uncultured Comamonas sp.]